jgi:hypothetical protein
LTILNPLIYKGGMQPNSMRILSLGKYLDPRGIIMGVEKAPQ